MTKFVVIPKQEHIREWIKDLSDRWKDEPLTTTDQIYISWLVNYYTKDNKQFLPEEER